MSDQYDGMQDIEDCDIARAVARLGHTWSFGDLTWDQALEIRKTIIAHAKAIKEARNV